MTAPAGVSRKPIPRTRSSLYATLALTVGAPFALLLAAGLVTWSWAERLPTPVAVHWGLHGVDQTAPSLTQTMMVALGAAAVVVVVSAAMALLRTPVAFARRSAAAIGVGAATLMGGIVVSTAWAQLDVTAADDVPVPLGALAVTLMASFLLSLGAAALTPADPVAAPGPVPPDATRSTVEAGERVMWTATVRSRGTDPQAVVWAVATLVLTVITGRGAVLSALVIPALLVALGHWRVTIDRSGIWARGLLGFPRTGLSLDQVVRADDELIRPVRDFGGFGVRSDLHGRYGLVLRKGEALTVERPGGGAFVVTVDGAHEGAALLNGLAERGRPGPAAPASR